MSKYSKDSQPLNMNDISLTDEVSKEDKFNIIKFIQF